MPPVRRAAGRQAPIQTSGGTVNFGDDSFYLGGLGLPEGNYATTYHTQMFQPVKQNGTPTGAAFLAVMMTAYPIDKEGNAIPGAEPSEHPLGCGTKSHESFVPSADGKGFETVAGGSGIGMNENCNWSIYRKSLVNAGLPPGTLTNDLTIIDGTWVHTRNIPEPEERKSFRKPAATGEAALRAAQGLAPDAEAQRNRVCVTVVEILEGGKPWEGTGGIPEEAPAGPAARPSAPARPAPRAAAPAVRGRVAAPPPPSNGEVTDEDLKVAAINGVSAVLMKAPNGIFKVGLSTGTFQAVAEAYKDNGGDDMAAAVIETYFQDNNVLNTLIGELGYRVNGAKVEPVPQQ